MYNYTHVIAIHHGCKSTVENCTWARYHPSFTKKITFAIIIMSNFYPLLRPFFNNFILICNRILCTYFVYGLLKSLCIPMNIKHQEEHH